MKIIQGVTIAREAAHEGGAGGGEGAGAGDDGAGAGDGGNKLLGAAGTSNSDGGSGDGGAGDGGAGGEAARPDWLPEQFYVDGQPQYEKLAGSYNEAVAKIREKTDTLREEIKNDLGIEFVE